MRTDSKLHFWLLAITLCTLPHLGAVLDARAGGVLVGAKDCIVKLSAGQAKSFINGFWDAGDNTGHAEIDHILDSLHEKHPGNPQVVNALESVAAEVKRAPEKYLNEGCGIKKTEFRLLVLSKTASSTVDFSASLDKLLNPTPVEGVSDLKDCQAKFDKQENACNGAFGDNEKVRELCREQAQNILETCISQALNKIPVTPKRKLKL